MATPSSSSLAPTFAPDRFSRLRTLLTSLFAAVNASTALAQHQINDVYSELDKARPWFLNLLNVPRPNKEEREELEKGTVKFGRKTSRVNPEFVSETLLLSSQLQLSELFSAHLLRAGIASQSRYGNRPAAETSTLIFHMERLDMLACLQLIFDPAVFLSSSLPESPLEILLLFGQDLKRSLVDLGSNREGSLVERIMVDLDLTRDTISSLQASINNPSSSSAPQNPGNNQFAPPSGAGAGAEQGGQGTKLSVEMLRERVASLKLERKGLGHVLYLLSYGRSLRKKEVQGIIRWLAKNGGEGSVEDEGMVGYMATTALAAFDLSDLKSQEADQERIVQERFLQESQFIKIMTSEIVEKPWKSTALQSVITLQWTLFLVEAFRFNRNLEQDTRLTEETVEGMVGSAIRGDAFKFLNEKLVGLNKESSSKAGEEAGRGANGGGAGLKEDLSVSMLGGPSQGRPGAAGVMGAAAGSKEKGEELVDASFKWHILTQVDFLIANFVTTMSPILRKLKHREEDVVLESSHSSSRSTRNNPATNASSSAPAPTPRADIEALFLLIAAVYRDSPPDAGLKYWHDADGRLFAFLRWAADARTPEMVKALFEMLSSLSVGPQSSTFAFNFLSSGGGDQYSSGSVNSGSTVCSWSSLFNALNFYSNQLPKVNEALQSSIQPGLPTQRPRRDANSPSTIPPDELALLKSFLRLLKNVVQSSPIARTALYENQHFKAIPTLLSLVNSIVPIEFKAALFDTLAAFCGPEGGSLGVDIAKQMWTALDKFEVIPSKGSSSSNGLYRSSTTASRPGSTGGIMAELEEAEATARTYPATIAFVHLLNSLIHTPAKSITLLHGVEVESHTIPESLGAGSRTPGIIPYVRFVLEDVFLKARTLQFADPKERWRLTERSLCFIEKCLATYDLSPLLNEKPDNSILASLALHPAFEILRRLLTEAPLLTNLLDIVSVGLDGLTDDAGQTPALAKSILRSLRIMNRIFQIQSLYIEVLLPTLAESQTFSGANRSFSFAIAPLDQHILYSHSVVVQIALLVNYIDDPETVLLAVKLIGHLSQSPFFIQMDRFENVYSSNMNRLVGIIDSSDESLRILDGFVRRLEADGQNDLDWPEDDPIESLVTSDARTTPSADLVQVIRSAILDLLLQNTVAGSSGPNLAHFLCGFDPTRAASELAVQDPQGQGARLSCLHIVFELLSLGAPRPTEDEDEELAEEALLMRNPGLAEKCAKLVFQLCSHQYTASATLRYIRTREDYAYRQISVFPTVPPSISQGALGEVNLTNGQKIVTSASALTSSLRFRSSILDNAALELHVINPTGLHAAKLVDALFTSPLTMLDHFESHVHDSGSADQPLIRIIDVLLSLDFEWQDDIPDTDLKLAFFASLDFNTCLTVNERGCEIYDFRSLVSAMNGVRRQLQKMGALSNSAQQEAIKLETRGVLLALAAENHRREISQAKHQCLISWQRVLDVVLFKSFELIPLEQRESMIFDLLSSVLRFVAAPDTTPAAAEIFCQVVLSLITKLRQGRREQILFSDGDELAGSLPADKLHTLLRQVLDAITQSGTTEFIRGNLYTVIINYLQLIASFTPSSEGSLKPELDTSKVLDDTAFVAGSTTSFRTGPRSSTLDGGTLAIFLSVIDKLAPILCRDALDGSEIWKTVAYTTLETLVTASKEDRSHRLLSVLAKTGYLRSFVQSLKDSENDLLGIMTPDPDDLNSLYVYEAKTALLIRISQSRLGAEILLDSHLFEVLSQCYFIDARPEVDQSAFELDSFLPAVIERYHQMLLPALQLIIGTLSSLGSSSPNAAQQALSFLNAHRETILLLLKEPSPILPLPLIKEFHLLATLLNFVLPKVDFKDLALPSGFGGFHLALLGLGGQFFLREKWEGQIVPVNDAERSDAQVQGPNGNKSSVFDDNVEKAVEALNRSLLAYFVLSTEPSEGRSLRPVLLPVVLENGLTPKHGAPTITAAAALLYDATVQLNQTIEEIQTTSMKLGNPSSMSTDEIEEIVLASGTEIDASKYSQPERHKLALQFLSQARKASRDQALSSLYIVETLLLLIWRHLLHFINTALSSSSDSSPSAGTFATILPSSVSLRFSQAGPSSDLFSSNGRRGGGGREVWERTNEELNPALSRVEGVVELPTEIFGQEARLRMSYLQVLARRLRELEQAVPEEGERR